MKQLPEMLRDALQAYAEKRVLAERTLEAIDAYQAAATRSVLTESDEEWKRACWDLYEKQLQQSETNDTLEANKR